MNYGNVSGGPTHQHLQHEVPKDTNTNLVDNQIGESSNDKNQHHQHMHDKDLEAEVTSLLENPGRESGFQTTLEMNGGPSPDRLGAYASEGEDPHYNQEQQNNLAANHYPKKVYSGEQVLGGGAAEGIEGRALSIGNSSKMAGYNSEITKDEERSPQMKMNPTLSKNKKISEITISNEQKRELNSQRTNPNTRNSNQQQYQAGEIKIMDQNKVNLTKQLGDEQVEIRYNRGRYDFQNSTITLGEFNEALNSIKSMAEPIIDVHTLQHQLQQSHSQVRNRLAQQYEIIQQVPNIRKIQQPTNNPNNQYGNNQKSAKRLATDSEHRKCAPDVIRADRPPHLSPVGSLTNLLTDLSSTGFRRMSEIGAARGPPQTTKVKDVKQDIRMTLLKQKEASKRRFQSGAHLKEDMERSDSTFGASRTRRTVVSHLPGELEGIHVYKPKVKNAIDTYFQQIQTLKGQVDIKEMAEFFNEEQSKAIGYLNSAPRKRIQQLGETKPLKGLLQLPAESHGYLSQTLDTSKNHQQSSSVVGGQADLSQPRGAVQSFPRLKIDQSDISLQPRGAGAGFNNNHLAAAGPSHQLMKPGISLQKLVQNEMRVKRNHQRHKSQVIPTAVERSFHQKGTYALKNASQRNLNQMNATHSQSELLAIILDVDQKQKTLETTAPMVNVSEAIHGIYKSAFDLEKQQQQSVPIGQMNEAPEAMPQVEKALEKREIMGLVQTNYPMLQNASLGNTLSQGKSAIQTNFSPFELTPANKSFNQVGMGVGNQSPKKFGRKLSILKSSSFVQEMQTPVAQSSALFSPMAADGRGKKNTKVGFGELMNAIDENKELQTSTNFDNSEMENNFEKNFKRHGGNVNQKSDESPSPREKSPKMSVMNPIKRKITGGLKIEYPLKEQLVNEKGQSIVYEDYKARMRAADQKVRTREQEDRNGLGDLLLDRDERVPVDKATEDQKDQERFEVYIRKGLVNIKNLALKNPLSRTPKEVEFLVLYLKHQFPVFQEIEKQSLSLFVQRLTFQLYEKGDIVARMGQACSEMVMVIDGELQALQVEPPSEDGRVSNLDMMKSESSGYALDGFVHSLLPGMSVGDQCFEDVSYAFPYFFISAGRTLTLTLSRKDFAEVLFSEKSQKQATIQSFLMKIPFVNAMPYHLVQDMSGLLYEQAFMADEVVFDVGEQNCDTIYFVLEGKLKVQAKVLITQETVIPIDKTAWEKTTKSTEVHYFVKQIDAGGYFGLEELVDIGLLRAQKNITKAQEVERQLRVTTVTNCKLLYMTAKAFLKIFGKYELEKLKEFEQKVDLDEIRQKVKLCWETKRENFKQLHSAVIDRDQANSGRVQNWLHKVHQKRTNLPNLMLEESRIKVLERREFKQIIFDKQEYAHDLNDLEKRSLLNAMNRQQHHQQQDVDDQSSIGTSAALMTAKEHFNASLGSGGKAHLNTSQQSQLDKRQIMGETIDSQGTSVDFTRPSILSLAQRKSNQSSKNRQNNGNNHNGSSSNMKKNSGLTPIPHNNSNFSFTKNNNSSSLVQ